MQILSTIRRTWRLQSLKISRSFTFKPPYISHTCDIRLRSLRVFARVFLPPLVYFSYYWKRNFCTNTIRRLFKFYIAIFWQMSVRISRHEVKIKEEKNEMSQAWWRRNEDCISILSFFPNDSQRFARGCFKFVNVFRACNLLENGCH